jgi:UDP-N-acetylmuramoyl-L-alanyl-D-glutamate--2,6-diaminopimelate ligase
MSEDAMTKLFKISPRTLEYDSRRVKPGSAFFAIPGMKMDGYDFVGDALKKGAGVIVSQRPAPPSITVPWIQVPEIRAFLAGAAARFQGEPSHRMQLVGITGTNGKTTTAYLIHSILRLRGPALLMGTVETIVGERRHSSELTTPESVDIQQQLREAVDAGCRFGAMEVSSHAIELRRVLGCAFPVAVFTNLTRDHLDFHSSMDEYFAAKAKLFDRAFNPALRCAVVNRDDEFGRRLKPPEDVRRILFGFAADADIRPIDPHTSVEGTRMKVSFFGESAQVQSSLIGRHNIYNLLAAAASCHALGFSTSEIARGLASAPQVPGRFEKVDVSAPFSVVIDYAHTPDALRNLLQLARSVTQGSLICLFGAGGDRDRSKRPEMGKVAAELADRLIVTSDNPRSEDPERIIREIAAGIPEGNERYVTIVDRVEAIRHAIATAEPGDLVLLAGKGHETYQDVRGRKIHMDEREIVRGAL